MPRRGSGRTSIWLSSLLLGGCSLLGGLDELSTNEPGPDAGTCVPGGDCASCETCVAYCGCASPDTFADCVAACPTGSGGGGAEDAASDASGGSGTGGSGGSGGKGGSDGGSGGPGTCTPCLEENCPNELQTCVDSQDCVALYDCFLACTDQACQDQCAATYPAGVSALNALFTCMQAMCLGECSG